MNKSHLTHLAGPEWAGFLRAELLPCLEDAMDLGDVLEIGPGPGLTTDLLAEHAQHVTAVEIDPGLAAGLRARLGDTVEVIPGDAGTVDLPERRFTAVICFSTLHHMPSARTQDRVFARCGRALRPGGTLLGMEAFDTPAMRQGHIDDTFTPLHPETLPRRLSAAGFTDVVVTRRGEHLYRFRATKSAPRS
jgi:SAM-dependent methyltransferase